MPVIDPKTGKPVEAPASDVMEIKKADWEGLTSRLDAFEKGNNFNNQQQPAPVVPAGPTLAEQVTVIDKDIAVLNTKIDEAVVSGKAVSQLMTERDTLTSKRLRLQIKAEDIDPAMSAGVDTINQISDQITRGNMKHYDIVKNDVEASLASLPPNQRMNPKMRQAAYNIAVGQNIDKIMEAQKEEMLRSVTELAAGNPPAGGGSRNNGGVDNGDTPKPEDVLSPNAIAAIASVGKTPDQYYKGLGHDGWAGYYQKHYAKKEA